MARILISAYACEPYKGSEPGVGWNWALEARRLGHDVFVLVSPGHQTQIEKACETDALACSLHWVFPQANMWPLEPGRLPKHLRLHNIFWQRAALAEARILHAQAPFDLVHHITWGGLRDPSFLGQLGVPFAFGPLGGGETSPKKLRTIYSMRGKAIDFARDVLNAFVVLNPLLRSGFARAQWILTKTSDSARVIPSAYRSKCRVLSELGLNEDQIAKNSKVLHEPRRLLFVGRFIEWKGARLALTIFEKLHVRYSNIEMTFVGEGPDEEWLKQRAQQLGVNDKITISPWVDHKALFDIYDKHDLFVFPSLHDSSGNVVLEALSRGLPVVCLDCGGPKEIVTPSCGIIVATNDGDVSDVTDDAATSIATLFNNPTRYADLSSAALKRASEFEWRAKVGAFYGEFVKAI